MDVRPAPANLWTSDHLAVFEASAAFTGVIITISAPNSARLNPIVPAIVFTSDMGSHHSTFPGAAQQMCQSGILHRLGEIASKLWDGNFRSPCYFAASCGASIAIVRQCIESQWVASTRS